MPLSYEHVGSKKPAKINTYMLTRAELLITLCYEIPCIQANLLETSPFSIPKLLFCFLFIVLGMYNFGWCTFFAFSIEKWCFFPTTIHPAWHLQLHYVGNLLHLLSGNVLNIRFLKLSFMIQLISCWFQSFFLSTGKTMIIIFHG